MSVAPTFSSRATRREEETRAVGRELAALLAPDGILLLSGDLGSGKTVLAQGVAAGLGIDPRQVQSPTFTLVREHEGEGGRLVHVDLYRLEPEETLEMGLEELFASPGVKVVEWAERLAFEVPGALRCEVLRRSGDEREIRPLAAGGSERRSNPSRVEPDTPAESEPDTRSNSESDSESDIEGIIE